MPVRDMTVKLSTHGTDGRGTLIGKMMCMCLCGAGDLPA